MRIQWAAVALAVLCATAPASAQQPLDDYTAFTTVTVAPGIYTYVSPECTAAGVVSGNVTAIVGERAVLVVDSGHFPTATRRIIAHLRSVTDKPVRYLLNTHWHQDHIMGNAEFRDAYPAVTIFAHPFTAQELSKPENGSGYQQLLLTGYPRGVEVLRAALASGKRPNGTPLSQEDRASLPERIAAYETGAAEAAHMRFVAPDVYASEIEFPLGGRTAKVQWIGEGNTEGDLVVYVPEDKLLITGDMIVFPTPFALDSDLLPWAKTLDTLAAFDALKIIPGHGPVMENKDYIYDVRDLLRSVESQVASAKAAGKSKEETRAGLDVDSFHKKYVTTPLREGAFQMWFLRPIVENAYKPATTPGNPQ